jgi:hypothetical protein
MMRIKNLAKEQGARCLVIDPVSALSKRSNEVTAHSVAERLIDWTKIEGITTVCTSLLDESGLRTESTPMEISTIADTWIHLDYLMNAGERNRSLSIIKSRGTAHSNQVRELILSDVGVTLADAYTAGGEVVIGTQRWEKERAVKAAREESEALEKQKQRCIPAHLSFAAPRYRLSLVPVIRPFGVHLNISPLTVAHIMLRDARAMATPAPLLLWKFTARGNRKNLAGVSWLILT